MEYVVTWTEGEEVCYRFVSGDEIEKLLEADKHYIIAGLSGQSGNTAPAGQ
ncbi:MAG: hypothetical protein K6T80_03470 [Firmicutes bacterium]|nr:hypothetical protein [Bacillota bacterium]